MNIMEEHLQTTPSLDDVPSVVQGEEEEAPLTEEALDAITNEPQNESPSSIPVLTQSFTDISLSQSGTGAKPLTPKQARFEDVYASFRAAAFADRDYSEIEKLRIVYLAGKDRAGRQIAVVEPIRLNPKQIDLDLLLLYFIYVLDPIVENDYCLVFIGTNINSDNRPPLMWLKKAYSMFNRKYKKNLKSLYIVHPNNWISLFLRVCKTFVSAKFWKKVSFVQNTNEIYKDIDKQELTLPNYVLRHNARQFPPPAVFGAPLALVLMRENRVNDVPLVVVQCHEYLKNYYETEGLFRLSGAEADIKKIVQAYNNGENVDLSKYTFPHTVASSLKRYFGLLPDKLISTELIDAFFAIQGSFGNNEELWTKKTLSLLVSFPPAMKRLMKYLFGMLKEVSLLQEKNKMSASNLAVVFGPNLIPETATLQQLGISCSIIEKFITHYDKLFGEQFMNSFAVADHPAPAPSPDPIDLSSDTM